MKDSDIVDRLKKGDKEAFISIVELFKHKIISLCYSYTEDYQEAEDISQEIFISLYNNIGKFRGDSSLSTYIYKIAVSKCLDFKRKRNIKGFLTDLLNISSTTNEDLDEKYYIRHCISSLPKDLKSPIVLYYYIGLNQKEIAEVLGISAKAVEGRIYRAKLRLKETFSKEGYLLCNQNGII